MSQYEVVLRRRLPARWYLALVGLILVLQGGGVLFGWAPVPRILELLYPNKEPPAFESRDLTWAWVFLIIGAVLLVWIVARLVGRRQVIRADGEGVHLPLSGPFGRPTLIPWSQVGELDTRRGSDDFGSFPVVLIGVEDARLLPRRPWGARWLDGGMLSLSAAGWAVDPAAVVEQLEEVRTALAGSPNGVAGIVQVGDEVGMDHGPTADRTEGPAVPAPDEDKDGLQA